MNLEKQKLEKFVIDNVDLEELEATPVMVCDAQTKVLCTCFILRGDADVE